MDAQLIDGGTTPDRRAEMDRIVTDEMLPALALEPGYAGALNLVCRGNRNGDAMLIVLRHTEAQARRPLASYDDAFLQALASIAASSTGTRRPISVGDVNARA